MSRIPRISLLLAAPLVAAACSNDQGFSTVDNNGGGDGPQIQVSPGLLEFGVVTAEDDAVVQTFLIESVGDVDLEVTGIEIVDDNGSYTIVSEETSFILPTGGSAEVDVAFVPWGAYEEKGDAIISSNDEDDPQVKVELLGEGAVPELAFDPDPIDYGDTYVGCTKTQFVDLINVGTDTAEVYTLEHGGALFELIDYPQVPFTLEPGEYVTLVGEFSPADQTDYTGKITVTSNEPRGERLAEETGAGKYAGEYLDSWEIPSDPPSDIIFFVDQSCSMDDDQTSLANNFGTFISQLSTYSNDWQIMVANGDNGCNNSGILTPSTTNYQSKFQSAVKSGGGIYTEAGLIVTDRAVEATDSSECNSGFMRSGAMLHIIMVSDEPEQSPGSWSTYVSNVQTKKGSTSNVRYSAIAGPVPGGCGSAAAGTGYSEAVSATGGVFLSICDNWSSSSNLALLAEASINQDTFELSREPIESTIVVSVNGYVLADSEWTYDAASNEVILSSAPGEGDEVDIEYAGVADCD